MEILTIFFIGLAVYFVPTIVAVARGHRNATAIGVLNLLLGWMLVPWVIALVWACLADQTQQAPSAQLAPPLARAPPPIRSAEALAREAASVRDENLTVGVVIVAIPLLAVAIIIWAMQIQTVTLTKIDAGADRDNPNPSVQSAQPTSQPSQRKATRDWEAIKREAERVQRCREGGPSRDKAQGCEG
jgi:hypothetical protein